MKKLFISWIFVKSQTASFLATSIDFLCMYILVEWLEIWYVTAAALSALAGAISNFMLGRHWCYLASDDVMHHQAIRYMIVALGSLMLNVVGIYLLTDGLGIQYMLSKLVVAIVVAIAFNYPLQRFFVFRFKE